MKASALRWLFGLALLGLVAAAWAFRDHFDAAALQAWVESAGAAGPVIATLTTGADARPLLGSPRNA
jgi:uncharacterized membrane protein YdjX (TVP38/TMEM64 family)